MKLHATVGDYEGDVDIRIEGSRVFAVVDDRTYELDLQRSVDNRLLLMIAGRVFDCRVDGDPSIRACRLMFRSARSVTRLRSPIQGDCEAPTAAGALAGGAARIMAPMPGKVVRVLVEAGARS